MKKQNELSKPNDAGAKRKVKRSQLGGAKQVGAAGKKAAPAVRKHSAFGSGIIQAGRQAGQTKQSEPRAEGFRPVRYWSKFIHDS